MIRSHAAKMLFLALCLAGSSFRAGAVSIVGEWQGTWQSAGATATATFDLWFIRQTPAGAVTGIFDWTCTSGFACSGIELAAGTVQASNALTMSTTGFVQPIVNLVPSVYSATVTADGAHIVNGTAGSGTLVSADRIASVIPADISILGGTWQGTWRNAAGTATADFDLVFTSQVADGAEYDVAGYFDWTCTSGFACSGRELIAGTLLPDHSLQLATTGFVAPTVNLVSSVYSLLLIGDGSNLIGLGDNTTLMRAQHVPEPSMLLLAVTALLLLQLQRAIASGPAQ
jgi:hypothetical protein